MVNSRTGNLRRNIYSIGQFVDVLIEGQWLLGIVERLAYADNSQTFSYHVMLTNENVSKIFRENNMRPSETFSQELALELEQEMPDPSQEITDSIQPRINMELSQSHPWSSQDFVKPAPKKPPATKRFLSVTDSEIDKLQDQSKSKNTHKLTGWGVRTLRGKRIFYFIYLHLMVFKFRPPTLPFSFSLVTRLFFLLQNGSLKTTCRQILRC